MVSALPFLIYNAIITYVLFEYSSIYFNKQKVEIHLSQDYVNSTFLHEIKSFHSEDILDLPLPFPKTLICLISPNTLQKRRKTLQNQGSDMQSTHEARPTHNYQ